MRDKLRRILNKIQFNGIEQKLGNFEAEKQVAFNLQIIICVFVSFLFFLSGLIYHYPLLIGLTASYTFLFSASFYFIHKHRYLTAINIYLFTSNYAVYSISHCFGYESGFYFYFFTTPLTVYISYDRPLYRLLALSTYLINALFLNFLHQDGILVNPGIFNPTEINIIFNLNLLNAFLMCYIFVNCYSRISLLKNREAQELYDKQRILEAAIHLKELNEAKVQFQYKKLESEYQQLDMFSHIISHNLRGPISRLSGIIELLRIKQSVPDDQKELMEHLNTSVVMIDDIIKDLNYILVQKKLGQESTVEIDLQEILDEVKLHLSEEISATNAFIQTDIFEGKIYGVRGIMISIFYNLLSNSIKYALPNQRPLIFITAHKSSEQLILTFRDEGLGFDSEKYQDKIFNLYKRFHNHVTGKGMGLFLVKSHVDMLGGTIDVESKPRKGATFTITLPLLEKSIRNPNPDLINAFNN